MSISAASFTVYFFYCACANFLTFVVIRRIIKKPLSHQWKHDRMLLFCRIGILLLTIGTSINNMQYIAGCFSNFNVQSDFNVALTWFCILDHEVFTALSIIIPFQFMISVVKSEKYKRRLTMASVIAVILFAIVGITGLILVKPVPFTEMLVCEGFNQPIKLLHPESSPKTSLACVVAYSVCMILCGVLLVYEYGRRSSWTIFLVTNIFCLIGQSLLTFLGPVYKCYASNFWEQIAFMSAVVADAFLNLREDPESNSLSPVEVLSLTL
jgi:hypothetical protein